MRLHFLLCLKSELITCQNLTLQPDALWHTSNKDVHALTQKSSSILPITPLKLKLESDM